MNHVHETDEAEAMERELTEMPEAKRNNILYILRAYSRIPEAKAREGLQLFRNALADETGTYLDLPSVRERFRAVLQA